AASTIVMAACLAAARVCSEALDESGARPNPLAIALDDAKVSVDDETCRRWLAEGRTRAHSAPWNFEQGPPPTLEKLMIVSAGGLGGNVSQIVAQSHIHIGVAYTIDQDVFDLSNLNRSAGIGIGALGVSKAFAAAA